jgi:hypothetical protein
MVYDDVSDILEHEDPELCERYAHILDDLKLMGELAEILRKKRKQKGSLDFDFDEAEIMLDEDEVPVHIGISDRRTANRLIEEFMLAAKCSGLSTGRKIFKHLIPNVMPQLIVSMTLGLGSIILMEATLGYLNIGAGLDDATWGQLIGAVKGNTILLKDYPNFWLPPGICITLAILGFNFVGDGLRDAFDPKMKR